MPRMHGIRERFAQIVVKEIGAEVRSGDLSCVVVGMTMLPTPNYRPPGHPERPQDPGPIVYLCIGDGPQRYLEAPALIHQDRYCAMHHHIDKGPLADFMERLQSMKIPVGKGSPDDLAVEAIMNYRKDALNIRPCILPVRQHAKAMSTAPLDGLVCFDLLWTREVCG